MARKVRGFERVLDAPALFAVAYDEIGSSIYFALGIVAAQALGLTPVVLLASGVLFLIVSLSYAEGTAALPQAGGAATFTRRAFNDLAGFTVGWVLFLDFLIVIALSTLFLPHYLAAALSAPSLTESPWDVIVAVGVIAAIVGARLVRHSRIHTAALVLAVLDISVQVLVDRARSRDLLLARSAHERVRLRRRSELGRPRSSRSLSRCSPTPGSRRSRTSPRRRVSRARSLPRSLFSSIGLVVVTHGAHRRRGGHRVSRRRTDRAGSPTTGCRRRSWGS